MMATDIQNFLMAAKVIKTAYDTDADFRSATIASIMSIMKELKGSHGDEDVAVAIADRLFGDN